MKDILLHRKYSELSNFLPSCCWKNPYKVVIITAIWRLCFPIKSGTICPRPDSSTGNSNIDFQMTVHKKEKRQAIILHNGQGSAASAVLGAGLLPPFSCGCSWVRQTRLSSIQGIKRQCQMTGAREHRCKELKFYGFHAGSFLRTECVAALKEGWEWERLLLLPFHCGLCSY